MTRIRFLAATLLYAAFLPVGGGPVDAQVLRDADISSPRVEGAARVLPVFDGILVNRAFVDRIAPDPVQSFALVETGGAPILRMVVLRDGAVLGFDLSEEGPERALRYAGYPVASRARSEIFLHPNGADWPFFGDDAPWFAVETRLRRPGQGPDSRITIDAAFGDAGSRGRYHEITARDGAGETVARSGGLTIAATGADATSPDSIGEICADQATRAGEAVKGLYLTVLDPVYDLLTHDNAEGVLIGLGALGGAVATKSVPGTAAGAGLGYYADKAGATLVPLHRLTSSTSIELGARLSFYLACMDGFGVIPGIEGLQHLAFLGLPDGPPAGAMLQLVCIEWSREWEEGIWGDGEVEVILHTSKCLRMKPVWVES